MTYTKKQFGSELKAKLSRESDCSDISKWAFKIYTDYGLEFESGLDYFVLKLVAMEEGPEFLLSKEELELLADELSKERL
ncbi:MAG: hypothetical protein K1000chlam3_00369 [Chlamydiae bacterium]|nr:hypothetical protein [Chlamydiota bacterium]